MLRVTEPQFADDVVLYTKSWDCLESVARNFVEGAREWGLTVVIEKTKEMAVGDRLGDEVWDSSEGGGWWRNRDGKTLC